MSVAVGTVETARFAFTTRELTEAELATYVSGGKLPAGVGVDVTTAKAEVLGPADAPAVIVSGGSITHDGTGEYHFLLTVAKQGLYRWRGLGYNGSAEQVAATPYYEIVGGEDSAGTIAGLIAAVLEDGQFDASEAQVLRWLDARHRELVARSRCYRRSVVIGSTAEGVASYQLPQGVIEIEQVTVGSYVYGNARHHDFAEGALGYLWLGGGGGIAGREDTSTGESLLRLFPAPTAAQEPGLGAEVKVWAAMQPPPLTKGQDSSIKVPDNYLDALVAGAIATGMLRMESRPDIAGPHETIFQNACGELLKETNRKFRGSGPAQIRVVGVNA